MRFQTLFGLGMKRHLPRIERNTRGLVFDIGSSGRYRVPGAMTLGLPDWRWPRDLLPCGDGSASEIHCYHFLEHLAGEDAILFLQEAQRALMDDGVLNFAVPYYSSGLQAQDLTHKSFWNEETFRNLFNNQAYTPHAAPWTLRVGFQLIAGVNERNLSLIGQLIKGGTDAAAPKWFYPTEIL
jgi:hypothetical protein